MFQPITLEAAVDGGRTIKITVRNRLVGFTANVGGDQATYAERGAHGWGATALEAVEDLARELARRQPHN